MIAGESVTVFDAGENPISSPPSSGSPAERDMMTRVATAALMKSTGQEQRRISPPPPNRVPSKPA